MSFIMTIFQKSIYLHLTRPAFNTGKFQMSAITRLGNDQNKHNTYLPAPKQLSVLILLIVYIRLHSENNNYFGKRFAQFLS